MKKKTLALFDFDGTLIKGNSLPRFLWHFESPLTFIKKSICSLPLLIKYLLKIIDNHNAKERIFHIFFAGKNKDKFTLKAEEFSLSIIPSLVKTEAIERLKWHNELNHECILISASIQEYLIPWASTMGFSKVLATSLEVDQNNIITGKFSNKNCHGVEKVRRIKEYLKSLNEYEIYVYGDSAGDKELFELADFPFYRSFQKEKPYPNE